MQMRKKNTGIKENFDVYLYLSERKGTRDLYVGKFNGISVGNFNPFM